MILLYHFTSIPLFLSSRPFRYLIYRRESPPHRHHILTVILRPYAVYGTACSPNPETLMSSQCRCCGHHLYSKTGRGREDGGATSIYWGWCRMKLKKHCCQRLYTSKQLTNKGWRAPSWPHRRCQQPAAHVCICSTIPLLGADFYLNERLEFR